MSVVVMNDVTEGQRPESFFSQFSNFLNNYIEMEMKTDFQSQVIYMEFFPAFVLQRSGAKSSSPFSIRFSWS